LRQYICYTVKKNCEKNMVATFYVLWDLNLRAKKKKHNVKKTCEIYGEKTSAWMPVFYCKKYCSNLTLDLNLQQKINK